ncbi:riboflavin biosynthesis protein RibD [Clostridium polyendosporum]|uniref:Riboflavin biosynthesis protein RibD n=1 Tax=Clostridium polyendosporum TaxID=69208 RepID=A0A919VFW3_9CLOT|nr:bifunctional diaminohydroxyphosphoribosylaminopyrimidine deaminase/5-amino-6-(5-phosphoribosylamino)uracil reductase RibD [Clostridium polyendosporum]GIM28577.1 riboflavin biosynthesis protein RibD [Clostridium polyendosporum]
MDNKYMAKALELAKKGIGNTSPNPLVGAVIVKDHKIIGEGYHQVYGGPHAEVNAFRNAKEAVEGATMYVTLEPCSHYGKTPPCANAIVEKKIARVVIGMKDPNPLVAGNGIRILEENGIEVVCGVLEEECKKINEIFIKYITTKTPFVIMKTAMTLDGKIAAYTGDSKWITGEDSRKYVHEIRNNLTGIMVGIGTVLKDNPMLTTRIDGGKNPIRIIVDSKCRIPLDAKVLDIDDNSRCIISTTDNADSEKIEQLKDKGAIVITTPAKNGRVDLSYLMKQLGEMKIDSILLEGGSELNYSALEEGIVDKVLCFIAPKIVGGDNAKTPVGGQGKALVNDAIKVSNITINTFNDDVLIEGYIQKEV